jgi:2-keto-4-pentenoate hydratase
VIALDERIVTGMRAQLASRRAALARGEVPIGWKVGFAAPAALELLGTDRPLVGYLLGTNQVASGSSVSVGSWANPALEPEIYVRLGADVRADAPWDEVRSSIAGVGPAIELADVAPPPTDVVEILSGNIFHRHVVLGPLSERRDGSGITGSVSVDGAEVASTSDPAALTGEVVEVVRLTAELLGGVGCSLLAGDTVITGSVVPPVAVAAGQTVAISLPPLGSLSVTLTS